MPTVQQVIDVILSQIPGGKLEHTVDTIKCGDPSQEVTSIVTTFMASYEVIEKAIALGANFIITHEPTYYNGSDDLDTIKDDPTYLKKRKLLDDHNIVIWRFHDHWHRHEPDGIGVGVIRALGWAAFVKNNSPIMEIPETTVGELTAYVKEKLGIEMVRVVGDLDMPVRNVVLMVGCPPAEWQIKFIGMPEAEVLLAGEVREWETSEYVRDAVLQGQKKALLVLGHALSEEPGMAYLVDWLQPHFPAVTITHVPVGDAFTYV